RRVLLADLGQRRGEAIGEGVAHGDELHPFRALERVENGARASAAAADQPDADRVGARRVRPGHHRRERESKRGRRGRLDEIATRRRSGELVSAHACPPSSTSRYWELSLVMAERKPLRLSCSSTARTTRKPANRALVC